jgi:hypothetical protein
MVPGVVVDPRRSVVYLMNPKQGRYWFTVGGWRASGTPNVIYVGQQDRIFLRTAPAPVAFKELTAYPGRGGGREVNGIVIDP